MARTLESFEHEEKTDARSYQHEDDDEHDSHDEAQAVALFAVRFLGHGNDVFHARDVLRHFLLARQATAEASRRDNNARNDLDVTKTRWSLSAGVITQVLGIPHVHHARLS